ncbi:MAG: two-component regulator propeller domain-containing protein [Ignavibacteriaceae bacterium]
MITKKITLAFIFCLASLHSQTEEYIFKQLTDADGLSQSTIFTMIQDKDGYLWLGTVDGLNRYDGYEFRIFENDPTDSTTISDNFISAIFQDSDGFIWVGTINGYLNRFDNKTEIFKRFFINDFFSTIRTPENNFYDYPLAFSRDQINTISTIAEDTAGYLWIGTWGNGIIKYDRKNRTGTHIYNNPDDPNSLSSNRVLDILADKDGNIWIATFGGGIDKLVKDYSVSNNLNPKFLRYKAQDNIENSLSDNKVITLFEDKIGNLWIGTFYGGLNKLDVINKYYPPDKAEFLTYVNKQSNSNSLSNNTVMAIEQDFDGNLWIGTFGGGLDRFEIASETFVNYSRNSSHNSQFPDVELLSLFIDRSGILWAGSHLGEGVTKIQQNISNFEIINRQSMGNLKLNDDVVWSLMKDREDNLWVGTYRGGINILDFKSKQTKILKNLPQTNSLSDNHVRSFAQDKFGNIWIGTYSGGLNRINHNSEKIDVFKNESSNINSLSANQVLDIYVESENAIWVATFGGGLNKLSFSKNSSGKPDFKVLKHNPSDPSSISDDRVYSILKDSKGNFWVGTYGGGLNKLNEKTFKFESYIHNPNDLKSISSNKVLCIIESSKKEIWIGTSGSGLNKFDHESKSFKTYSIAQGLTSTVVYGILEDNSSNLWLSTDDGIFLFNSATEKFTQFGIEDGAQSLEFSGGAYFKDSKGIMYFGGINGFNYFNPDSIVINSYIPPVVISSIKILDEKVKGNPDELILSHDQNYISLEFASLDFSFPNRNKYSYILQGFQKFWTNTEGPKRSATYTNLPAGEFTFLVKGTNSDGIWNEKATAIRIIINPPFWQTWWFATLAIIIIAFFIYYLSTIRIKNQLEIEKLKLKIASDLHDNIGSGLTEISILSELAERNGDNTNSVLKIDLHKISDTARNLVDSMSDIVWVVNPQRDSLHDLIVKLKDSYNEFFSSIGISFQVKNVEKSDDIKLPMEYKQNLLLMFREAINNAIKHSICKKIILEAFFKNDLIEIVLKDDGVGFDSEQIHYGNGIRNMRDRAKKLKGNIKLESEVEKGTTIKFSGKIGKLNRIKTFFD